MDSNEFENLMSVRPIRSDEINFVLSSWLKSARMTGFWPKVNSKTFFINYQPLIETAIERGSIFVGVPKTEPNIIVAYISFEIHKGKLIIHFIYVKNIFRNQRISSHLINHIKKIYKIESDILISHYHAAFKQYEYNPFLLFGGVMLNSDLKDDVYEENDGRITRNAGIN